MAAMFPDLGSVSVSLCLLPCNLLGWREAVVFCSLVVCFLHHLSVLLRTSYNHNRENRAYYIFWQNQYVEACTICMYLTVGFLKQLLVIIAFVPLFLQVWINDDIPTIISQMPSLLSFWEMLEYWVWHLTPLISALEAESADLGELDASLVYMASSKHSETLSQIK